MLKIFIVCVSMVFSVVGGSAFAACTPGGEQHECSSGDCAGKYYKGDVLGWQKCGKGYYCPGTGIAECCPDSHSDSDAGATEEEDCYKKVDCIHYNNTKSCKSYYEGITECGNGMNSNTTVHLENNICYTGWLYCNQFANNCDGTVSGYMKWDNSRNKWHTVPNNDNRCLCESSYESDTCTGSQKYLPHYTQQYIDITTSINFVPSEYFCTKCKAGYYVNAATDINSDHENDDCANDKVCKCTIVSQGHYINGQCNIPDSVNPNTNICPPTPCPAGQTTDGTGATSLTECHFTGETQFCDAGGCFTLGEIQSTYSINPSAWTPVN